MSLSETALSPSSFLAQRFLAPRTDPSGSLVGWMETGADGYSLRIAPTSSPESGGLVAHGLTAFWFVHTRLVTAHTNGSLVLRELDGEVVKSLAEHGHGYVHTIARDGTGRAAFTSSSGGDGLWVMEADGSVSRHCGGDDEDVTWWLLDPSNLSVLGSGTIGEEETVIDVYDSGLLTFPPTQECEPFASTGGAVLVCAAMGSGDSFHLYDTRTSEPFDRRAPEMDVEEVYRSPVTGEVDVVRYCRGRKVGWHSTDRVVMATLNTLMGRCDTDDLVISRHHEGDDVWLVTAYYEDGPAGLYLHDRRTGVTRKLMDEYDCGQTAGHGVTVLRRGRVESYLHTASSTNGSSLVVLLHGGPWESASPRFSPVVHMLLAAGHTVLHPNWRGSTGFGSAVLDAGNGEWGRAMIDDITHAIRKAVARQHPSWVALVGHSYGGYAVLEVQRHVRSDRAVALMPPTDLVALLESSGDSWGPTRRWIEARIGHDGVRLAEDSPTSHPDALTSPTLIVAGTDDDLVPFDQVERYAVAAAGHGEVCFVPLDCGHLLEESRHEMDTYERVLEWIEPPAQQRV